MLLQLLPWRLSAKGVDKVELELTTSLTPGATSACQPKRRRMAWVRPPTRAALLHMRRQLFQLAAPATSLFEATWRLRPVNGEGDMD